MESAASNTRRSDPLVFEPGIPTITEVGGKRFTTQEVAGTGRIRTSVTSQLSLSDDRRTIVAQVELRATGMPKDTDEVVFEMHCVVECSYTSEVAQKHIDIEEQRVVNHFSSPLYHRAVAQVQDLAWNMGFNTVHLPLFFPGDVGAQIKFAKRIKFGEGNEAKIQDIATSKKRARKPVQRRQPE